MKESKFFGVQLNVKSLARRALLGGVACAALTSVAWAQGSGEAAAKRSYVAISLLGDDVKVILREKQTGTRLDANVKESFTLAGGVFDAAALAAMDQSVRRADPGAKVFALKLSSAKVLGDPAALIDGDRLVVPAALAPTLAQLNASHLLLLTPHRAESKIRTRDQASIGLGSFEGLGYYLDRETEMRSESGDNQRKGFLAPYVYFKVTLVNLATLKVEGRKFITEGYATIGKKGSEAVDAWDILTALEKMELLRDMLKQETSDAVEALIKG
ncbi:PI-PLC domain-containing protein [Roseateles albus]|uniref:Curli production assembly/transport component CsgG n=1 Tax=Roseateles albus TaxID=2987525 RepID=A0ABT5K8L4_9BURK|nr:hypothetical protein [Roseateles albus]MDC8770270.1 hypothetical protein [Roseateles albus]